MRAREHILRITAVLAFLFVAGTAHANTWTVGRDSTDCDCPPANPGCCNFDDFVPGFQIGGGIDAALSSPSVVSGDTVLVWPGTNRANVNNYTIRLTMKSGVALIAKGYPDSLVIISSAAGAEPAIRLTNCNELTTVQGFRITWDAGSTGLGGGLSIFTSGGRIKDNVFLNCKAGIGAGVYLQTSTTTLENNLFQDNQCISGGGVIAVSGGAPTLINNTIVNALAPFGTDGASVYATGTDFFMLNNIIAGSQGASAVFCGGGNMPVISCNLFYDNQLGAFGGQCPDSTGTSGNFNADPLFCDTAGPETYALSLGSPALSQAGCGPIGYQSLLGNCAGSSPTPVSASLLPMSWGSVKAHYRR